VTNHKLAAREAFIRSCNTAEETKAPTSRGNDAEASGDRCGKSGGHHVAATGVVQSTYATGGLLGDERKPRFPRRRYFPSSRSSSTQTRAIGIWWATTLRCSLSVIR